MSHEQVRTPPPHVRRRPERWVRVALGMSAAFVSVLWLVWPLLSVRLDPPVGGTAQITVPNPGERSSYASWSEFGGRAGGGQYSGLTQINRTTVANLRLAWEHHSGDIAPLGSAVGGTSYEVTPIVANGKLYYCTPFNRIFALDPATGEELWSTDLDALAGTARAAAPCRGVAYWASSAPAAERSCERRIFKGDIQGRVFALDADTGKPCSDFGQAGIVSLAQFDYFGEGLNGLTSPPAIYSDLLIVGGSHHDNLRSDQPDGIVRALDVRTGEERWHFNPIPDALRHRTGSANVWSLFAVDEERGLVFLPTTSPSTDVYGASRKEDIPYANALVALDAASGAVRWHYQIVHHDLFDYDLPAQPILFDLQRDGRRVPAVAQITKMGYVFVFDRVTGEPIFPIVERSVPRSDVPDEYAAPTQPTPQLPQPFARQHVSRAELFGLTPFDRQACRRRFDELRYEGMYTPPSERGSLMLPSALGGGNWGGAALDPFNQLLIVKAQNIATILQLVRAGPERTINPPDDFVNQPLFGSPYRLAGEFFLSPLGVPCIPPPWGELSAIDLRTGRIVWRRPLGRVPLGPFLTPARWGSPNVAGPIVTAGGLIFVSATLDSKLRALDLATGEELWSANLPAPGTAVPMTYEAGSERRQFVVIAAGGTSSAYVKTKQSDALLAFALPRGER